MQNQKQKHNYYKKYNKLQTILMTTKPSMKTVIATSTINIVHTIFHIIRKTS